MILRRYRLVFFLSSSICLLFFLLGCDAFARKFTRKPKKDIVPVEDMVLAPEEYKGPQMTQEELYRRYFLFWKSWHEELINSLLEARSQKKQIDCAMEAIKNLTGLKAFIKEEKQKELDVYINSLQDIQKQIEDSPYGNENSYIRNGVERLKLRILKNYSYDKIKQYLK